MLPKPSSCSGCPLYEKPYGKHDGFSVPDGTGANGVFICAEALGADEEQEGRGLVGKTGHTLFQQLARVGIEREGFTIFNTVACRPPNNLLVKQPYELECIAHCAPNLDAAIAGARKVAKEHDKTFVIVTLGKVAFQRVMGYDYKHNADLLKKDYIAYPFWNEKYGAWVLPAYHPSYLVRGSTHLWPIVQFVFTRAIEISGAGLVLGESGYMEDPPVAVWERYVASYRDSLKRNPDNPLSYDIETAYKQKVGDEDEVGKGEEEGDHRILRIGFSFREGSQCYTCSVKWSAEYMSGIEELFEAAKFVLGWNSDQYDYPRVSRFVRIRGLSLDGMVAWHILNSALDKRLGFVTPFYVQNTTMWKHMDKQDPAYYNAKDAHMALLNWEGIKKNLVENNLWHVYERHWIQLSEALKYMSNTGVLVDATMRAESETKMQTIIDDVEAAMEAAVPKEARKWKIAKKQPKDLADEKLNWQSVTQMFPQKFCSSCGISLSRKWKKHSQVCGSSESTTLLVPQQVWARPLEFKISKLGMQKYQAALRHQAILSRKEHKVTFNEDAIVKLMKQYPRDPLYPLILKHRQIQKLLSTYVGISRYEEVEVPDDYILQIGERWVNGVQGQGEGKGPLQNLVCGQ